MLIIIQGVGKKCIHHTKNAFSLLRIVRSPRWSAFQTLMSRPPGRKKVLRWEMEYRQEGGVFINPGCGRRAMDHPGGISIQGSNAVNVRPLISSYPPSKIACFLCPTLCPAAPLRFVKVLLSKGGNRTS